MALSLDAVRKVAKNCFLREIYYNEKSMVVSFTSSLGDPGDFLRVNVYWSTGTVGTCLSHPTQGPRQLFRRGVDLGLLRTLMLYPRTHTGTGYHKRSRDESGAPANTPAKKRRHGVSRGEDNPNPQKQYGPDPADEETEALAERRQLQVDADVIAAKIAGVDVVLADYKRRREQKAEELRKQQAAVKQAQIDEAAVKATQAAAQRRQQAEQVKQQKLNSRGKMYSVLISDSEVQASFMVRCNTSDKFKTVKHVAVFDGGYFLSGDNLKSYWHGLPSHLSRRLIEADLYSQGDLIYLAVGVDAYYAELKNGSVWWSSSGLINSKSFDESIKESKSIKRVAFSDNGAWIIQNSNGSIEWVGIPKAMENKFKGRGHHLASAREFALGKNDSWFLGFEDGSCHFELPSYIADVCNEHIEGGSNITAVSMAYNCSDYIVRHT